MIQLVVVSLRGTPVAGPMSAQFGPAGGTIGRANTNTLVLDDPDRTVSRIHAQVQYRDGRFFIVDRGSNPLHHNGQALGAGREAPLSPGDRLGVGSFELTVQAAAAASQPAFAPTPVYAPAAIPTAADPFADLLAGLGSPPAPATAPAPPPAGRTAPADSLMFPDPMASGAGRQGAAPIDDPFADLLGSPPASAAAPAGARRAPDDFSDLGLAGAAPGAGIDNLFGGLGSGSPAGTSPLDDPLHRPNTSSSNDPFESLQLQDAPKPPAAARSDHLPIGQFGYTPPKAFVPPAAGSSLLDDLGTTPIPQAAPPPPAPAPRTAPASAPVAPAAPRTPQGAATDSALLAAFVRGVNSSHGMPDALTPELMERIGTLLRHSTEGTLQLLHARQQLKRQVRAEVTMIAAQANNPLKFSPTVEVALAHLLGPGMRGFMGPEAAMRDAYDDLRAHEFGVMVGMRAALAHVLERFTPDELEKKIAAKSAMDSLFSSNRKAKLWDQFVALYAGIASEAEDDFHSLFGKAFLEAYDEQMSRLKSGG